MTKEEVLFSTRVRKATRKIHSLSDALVNAKFAISLRDEEVWGKGLFVFYHVFAFLEDAQKRLCMPEYDSLFVHESLFRKKAFEADLQHYLGESWHSLPRSRALENYLEHLEQLEKDHPMMLMAYVYHLYLGLLSGGQILVKKRRMFGNKNKSTESYVDKVTDFNDLDIGRLKNEIRSALNNAAQKMSEYDMDAFIEESNQVFLMNNLLVNSIGGQNQVLYNMLMKISAIALLITTAYFAYKMK